MRVRSRQGLKITRGRTLGRVAAVYDLLSPLMTFFQEKRFYRETLALLDLRGHERVLDVGCATGTLTMEICRRLRQEGSLIVGLDAAPEMIRAAAKKSRRLNNIRFDTGIAERLEYTDVSFDRAVAVFFFHHVDYALKIRCLRELYRVLRPGGKAVIVDVDTPSTIFGAFCAWCGYLLFRQKEIKENIDGKLRRAISLSPFESRLVSTHLGYISVFELIK